MALAASPYTEESFASPVQARPRLLLIDDQAEDCDEDYDDDEVNPTRIYLFFLKTNLVGFACVHTG